MDALTIYTESPGGCRKRKREYFNIESKTKNSEIVNQNEGSNGILNAAFTSSTPNKDLLRASLRRSTRRIQTQTINNKENLQYDCMEIKSIAEIHLAKKSEAIEKESENPFEVIRKPPKKKKKSEIEEACFENAALNLEAPERTFNPFEIHRVMSPKTICTTKDSCFVNDALDIRVEDTNINPYEIQRSKSPITNINNGIENPALQIRSPKSAIHPTSITIGLPFKPTMGCRIDFQNVPLEVLLSSESNNNINKNGVNSKQLLPAIAEDDEVDIGKELDCYQLELENSINEAKLKKANIEIVKNKLDLIEEIIEEEKITLENDSDSIITNNISGIVPLIDENDGFTNERKTNENHLVSEIKTNCLEECIAEKSTVSTSQVATPEISIKPKLNEENNESITSDSDFEEPAPFVRCYRKPLINSDLPVPAERSKSLNEEPVKETKSKIGNVIRRSIRKYITHTSKKHEDNATELLEIKEEDEPSRAHNNIFQTIRQSLRRKPAKPDEFKEKLTFKTNKNEISIIDCSERTKIFRSPNAKIQTKDIKVEKIRNIFSKHNKYNF